MGANSNPTRPHQIMRRFNSRTRMYWCEPSLPDSIRYSNRVSTHAPVWVRTAHAAPIAISWIQACILANLLNGCLLFATIINYHLKIAELIIAYQFAKPASYQ